MCFLVFLCKCVSVFQRWIVDRFHRCECHPAVSIHYLLMILSWNENGFPLPVLTVLDDDLASLDRALTFPPSPSGLGIKSVQRPYR